MASGDGPRGMDEGGAADVAPIAEGSLFWRGISSAKIVFFSLCSDNNFSENF